MNIGRRHFLEPLRCWFVFLLTEMKLAQLKAGLGKRLVEPGGLCEEAMFLLRGGGEQSADVALDGIDANSRMAAGKVRFRRGGGLPDRLQGLPGQVTLQHR